MAHAAIDAVLADALDGRPTELDLAGFTEAWIEQLVAGAFDAPVRSARGHHPSVKLTIGGGKKTRARYDEDALKHLTAALRARGYADDRGASACAECQGTYKYQHDTDKDLKYLHVFPRAVHEDEGEGGVGGGVGGVERSPEHRACTCELEEFKALCEIKVPSFSQKRALLRRMKVMEHALNALEAKVVAMETLSEREQSMYDSMIDVAAKIEHLQGSLDDMIKKGRLTKGEQGEIVDDLQLKLEDLNLMVKEANDEGKAKKAELLEQKQELVQKKIDSVLAKPPIVYTVPHERELADLKKELASLNAIVASVPKGKLMSGSDAAKCAKIPTLQERIHSLENSEEKGWYEDECRALLFPVVEKKPTKAKSSASGGGAKAGAGWLTKAATGGARAPTKSAAPKGPSNPFAMLGDD